MSVFESFYDTLCNLSGYSFSILVMWLFASAGYYIPKTIDLCATNIHDFCDMDEEEWYKKLTHVSKIFMLGLVFAHIILLATFPLSNGLDVFLVAFITGFGIPLIGSLVLGLVYWGAVSLYRFGASLFKS